MISQDGEQRLKAQDFESPRSYRPQRNRRGAAIRFRDDPDFVELINTYESRFLGVWIVLISLDLGLDRLDRPLFP